MSGEAQRLLGAAVAEHQAGRLDEAEKRYRRILMRWPNLADAHNLLGLAQHQRGEVNGAIVSLRRAVKGNGAHPAYRYNLGNALAANGDFAAAEAELAAAARLSPTQPEIWFGLGTVRLELGTFDTAAAAFRHAIGLAPGFADAHYNLGLALARAGKPADAIASYQAALAAAPDHVAARFNLGNAQWDLGRPTDSLACYEAVLQREPRHAGALLNAARSLFTLGRHDEAARRYRMARDAAPDWPVAWSAMLFALGYDQELSLEQLLAEHEAFARRFAAASLTHDPVGPASGRRLRVGFISPDFRVHSCAYFIEPLWRGLDRASFEIHAYSDVIRADQMTERLRGLADGWRDIAGQDDAAVAAQILADRIDILFDLAGHTDRNRLLVFARKPAPVQVTWLGYGSTTGLAGMDWRVSDAVLTPEDGGERFSEKVWRLPRVSHCYRPPEDVPNVGLLPALSAGRITFGSFNALPKLTPATVALWSRALEAVAGSRLLLKSWQLSDAGARDRLAAAFATHGVGAERLELLGFEARTVSHLARYAEVDIALDTVTYNGATTTCEALLMGVPAVSLAGDRTLRRFGASLLPAAGQADLVAGSAQEFVAIAARLAADRDALARRRAGLRATLLASELTDAAGFGAAMGTALRGMTSTRLAQ